MKIEDLEKSPEDTISELKDSNMQQYIEQALDVKAPIIHNTNKNVVYYMTSLHERENMLKGNVLYIEYIGEVMEEVFGHNFRTTSVYGTFHGEEQYGNPYILLPFGGEYSICYSTAVNDMYFNYHKVKMDSYDDIYNLLKKGWGSEILPEDIITIWNDFEYTVQEMKLSLSDYVAMLDNYGLEDEAIELILNKFKELIISKYHELIKTYHVTSDLREVFSDVGRETNPTVELMIKSPKYLMVSSSYILKKYKTYENFLNSVK